MAGRGNRIGITGQFDDQVTGKLGKLRDQFDRLGKSKGAQTVLQGVGMGAGISAWGLLDRAMSGAVDWFAKGIQGARDEEVGIARLTAALEANVPAWDGNTAAVESLVKAKTKMGFADDEIRDSLAKLVPATQDVGKAFDVQRIAMDLARLKGISLAEASDALVKVEAGQYRMLKSLGIELRKGATQTEALAAVQKAAAGQASAYLETSAGKAELMTQKWDELGEKVGAVAIGPLDDAVDVLSELATRLDTATDETADLGARLQAAGDIANAVNPMMWATNGVLGDMRERAEEAARATSAATARLSDFAASERDAITPTQRLGYSTDELREFLADLKPEVRDVAKGLKDVRDRAEDALEAFIEAALGPEQLRIELATAKDELRENATEAERLDAKIRRLRDAGKPVGELEDDLRDLRGEIIEGKGDVIRLTGRLEALGEIKPGSTQTTVDRLLTTGKRNLRTWADVLATLRAVNSVGVEGGGGTGKKQHRASGGPVLPGGTYTVGEEGQETLVMGVGGGGYVIPNAGGGSRGGGSAQPVVIQLQMDGREVARVVDRHLYYEAARAPQSAVAG